MLGAESPDERTSLAVSWGAATVSASQRNHPTPTSDAPTPTHSRASCVPELFRTHNFPLWLRILIRFPSFQVLF